MLLRCVNHEPTCSIWAGHTPRWPEVACFSSEVWGNGKGFPGSASALRLAFCYVLAFKFSLDKLRQPSQIAQCFWDSVLGFDFLSFEVLGSQNPSILSLTVMRTGRTSSLLSWVRHVPDRFGARQTMGNAVWVQEDKEYFFKVTNSGVGSQFFCLLYGESHGTPT
jgi:hypothetical protein